MGRRRPRPRPRRCCNRGAGAGRSARPGLSTSSCLTPDGRRSLGSHPVAAGYGREGPCSRSAFSDKASLIPRALSHQSPGETFSLSGLAEFAGCRSPEPSTPCGIGPRGNSCRPPRTAGSWQSGRIHLLKPYHRPSLRENTDNRPGLPVASDLQLMLDLWNHPMRGRVQGGGRCSGGSVPFGFSGSDPGRLR